MGTFGGKKIVSGVWGCQIRHYVFLQTKLIKILSIMHVHISHGMCCKIAKLANFYSLDTTSAFVKSRIWFKTLNLKIVASCFARMTRWLTSVCRFSAISRTSWPFFVIWHGLLCISWPSTLQRKHLTVRTAIRTPAWSWNLRKWITKTFVFLHTAGCYHSLCILTTSARQIPTAKKLKIKQLEYLQVTDID